VAHTTLTQHPPAEAFLTPTIPAPSEGGVGWGRIACHPDPAPASGNHPPPLFPPPAGAG